MHITHNGKPCFKNDTSNVQNELTNQTNQLITSERFRYISHLTPPLT